MHASIPRKRPINLNLATAKLAFGHRYAEAHETSLSQVVNDLLGALEQTVTLDAGPSAEDPLDGLLTKWPSHDKKELRKAQHETRLSR